MGMDDCIFCKIANGEVLKEKENHKGGEILSFLSLEPITEGHTIVIPKKHYRWFYDMPDKELASIFNVTKNLSKQLKEKTKADFIQLTIIGEDVTHVHVHLVPRKFEDGPISI